MIEDKDNSGISSNDKESQRANEQEANSQPATLQENDSTVTPRHLQSLLDAWGIGAHMANGEDPDEYVRKLREGWD